MPADRNYPATVAEILDPQMKFDRAALAAVRAFAAARPYRQIAARREQLVRALCAALAAAYGIRGWWCGGRVDRRARAATGPSPTRSSCAAASRW